MLKPEFTGRFKRDYKLAIKRGCDKKLLEEVISILMSENSLPPKYKDHRLQNSKHYSGMRECHIQPDWLLVYQIDQGKLILRLIRTGTHSELFN